MHVNTLCMTLIHERSGESSGRDDPLYDQKHSRASCCFALLGVADSGLLLEQGEKLTLYWGDEMKGTGKGRHEVKWDYHGFRWGLLDRMMISPMI